MKIPSLFRDRQFFRSLFTLAIPIMLQSMVTALVNFVDTIMIGRLGTVAIAAVGLGNQIFFLLSLLLFGICSGGVIFSAQFWGKGDVAGIRKNMGFTLVLALTAALVFSLTSALIPEKILGIYSKDEAVILAGTAYLRRLSPSFIPFGISMVFIFTLRSVEKVRLPIVATTIALSLNVILNYLFIFGAGPIPAMGVKGAAITTVISRLVEASILVSVTYLRKYAPAASFSELFAFNVHYARGYFRITLPVIANELLWSTGITTQNIIFARTGTDAIAAFNITSTVSMLFWTLFMGLGNAAAVLVGKKIGEKDEYKARDYASRLVRFAPIAAVGAALILYPTSFLLPFIFKVNPQTILIASQMFIILCCSYPIRAFNLSMIIGVCRAGGDTVFCMIYDTVLLWFFALPLAATAAFVMKAPVWVIYLCVCAEDPLKAILGLWRLKSGKWLHNVTDGLS